MVLRVTNVISRGDVAIFVITTPCAVLALAVVAMRINPVTLVAFSLPVCFAAVVFIGLVRAMFR